MDIKTSSQPENGQDFQAILTSLANLSAEVSHLAKHVGISTMSAVEAAQSGPISEAVQLKESILAAGKSKVKAAASQVESNPLASLMLAFSLGFIGSRLLAR